MGDTIAPHLDKMNADDTRIAAIEGIGGRDAKSGQQWKRPFSLEADMANLNDVLVGKYLRDAGDAPGVSRESHPAST